MRKEYSETEKIVISNIIYFRTKANMTQEELSKCLNKREYFIKELESQNKFRRELNISLISKISSILNEPVKEFFVLHNDET